MQAIEKREFRLLGVRVDNMRLDDAVREVVLRASTADAPPCQMAFVNAHCLNVACGDDAYREILGRAPRVFADGVGVRLGARVHGIEVAENVNGTDLFPRLCAALEHTGLGVYLLGARPGIVEGVIAWMAREYPGVRVAGAHHGYFPREQDGKMAGAVSASGAEVLLVAMGVPRQEKWIEENLARCGSRVALGVGALFDFYSSTVPRAPQWMRARGLEWVYRLYQEPGRMWRRYVVGNPQFLARVAGQRLRLPSFSRLLGRAGRKSTI